MQLKKVKGLPLDRNCALRAINVGINNHSASKISAINAGRVATSKEIVGNRKVHIKNGKEISDSNPGQIHLTLVCEAIVYYWNSSCAMSLEEIFNNFYYKILYSYPFIGDYYINTML